MTSVSFMNHLIRTSFGLASVSHLKCTSEPSKIDESFNFDADDELKLVLVGAARLSIDIITCGAY